MITLQYTKDDDMRDFYTVTLSRKPWFEPGETGDVFLQEGYHINMMKVDDESSQIDSVVLMRVRVSGGEVVSDIDWDAVDLVCAGDKDKLNKMLDQMRNHFSQIDSKILDYMPRGERV